MKRNIIFIFYIAIAIILSACSTQVDRTTIEDVNTSSANGESMTSAENTSESTTVLTTEETTEVVTEPSIYDLEFSPKSYQVEKVYSNYTFYLPLYTTYFEDVIFVVQKGGKILWFKSDESMASPEIFIDLGQIISTNANEKGLLGFALDPNFVENGYFYVNYTDRTGTIISRFSTLNEDRFVGDLTSELILLTYQQPYSNHNGGHLAFGPDGYLYIASGDGGSSGDPNNNAQNLNSLLGKILRIDVNQINEATYDIPADNPFINNDNAKAEIYAYGLRNPWRFSFDALRNLLIAADVGQDAYEEIDLIQSGGNYGWHYYEGTHNYKKTALSIDTFISPIWEYAHPNGESITGGFTYTGTFTPSLYGLYIYGDFISGKVWGLWINEDQTVSNYELVDTQLKIASFGLEPGDELLIIDYQGGLYRLVEN